jgi:hypothetical protein
MRPGGTLVDATGRTTRMCLAYGNDGCDFDCSPRRADSDGSVDATWQAWWMRPAGVPLDGGCDALVSFSPRTWLWWMRR